MLIKEIIERRSIREYKTDPVADELIYEVIKAGQFAPSARNNRSLEFIIIKDQATKDKMSEILENRQLYIKVAPVIIALVVDTTLSILPVQDLSVASENMLLQATRLGLGSVWKNVSIVQSEMIKKLLGVPSNFSLINLIPLGYADLLPPHSEADYKVEKIHNERW